MTTTRFLWRLIRYRPGLYLLDAILSIAGWLLFLAPGLIIREIFDTLSGAAHLELGVWWLIALLIGAQVARMTVSFTSVLIDPTFTQTIAALLRHNLLGAVLRRPAIHSRSESSGEAISRFRDDVDEMGRYLGIMGMLDLLGATIFGLIALAIMLRINATLTMLVFLPLVGVVAAAQAASTRVTRYRTASREATGRVDGLLGEMFGAVQAIQVAGAERAVLNRVRDLSENRGRAVVHDQVLSQTLNSVFFNAVNLGTGLILLLAGQSMRGGSFTVGDFALFVFFLTWVSRLTQSFGTMLARFQQARVSVDRLVALLPGEPAERAVEHRPLALGARSESSIQRQARTKTAADRLERLTVTGLSYRFPGSSRGISNIDMTVARGSLVVITGRVGAGKTTLLRAILGLLPADAGRILWNGIEVSDPATFMVPPRCAYTPQVPRLFSTTLRDNVLLGISEKQANLEEIIDVAVLGPDLAEMANGLDTLIGPRGVRLSGGQLQRAAAARMLARDPELLVVDDLSSALDSETERLLWERLRADRDRTILAVSHRPAVLCLADQIIVLEEGRIETTGRFDAPALANTIVPHHASREKAQLLWPPL